MSLFDRHVEFVGALRDAGLRVSVAEDIDAAQRAARSIDMLDREQLRAAYAAALVKRQAHRPAFDTVFDLYFPAVTARRRPTAGRAPSSAIAVRARRVPGDPALVQFRGRVARAAARRRRAGAGRLARAGVGRFGAVSGGAARRAVVVDVHAPWPGRRRRPCWLRCSSRRCAPDERGGTRRAHTRARRSPRASRVPAVRRHRGAAPAGRRESAPSERRATAVRPSADRHRPAARDATPTWPRSGARSSRWRGGWPRGWRFDHRHGHARQARLPPHDPGVAVLGRRADADAHAPAASAQDRPRDPLRRQRLGHLVRALHAAARLRAARAVHPGASVRVHRRPGRGRPASSGPASTSSRPSLGWTPRRRCAAGTAGPTTGGRSGSFEERHADAIAARTSLLVLGDARSNYGDSARAGAAAAWPGVRAARTGSTRSGAAHGTPAIRARPKSARSSR